MTRAPTPFRRPYHRFFSQCLQLLHAARVAGGPTAMRLARTLLAFNSAAPGAIIPLRTLTHAPQVPGHLHFARERLRVPQDVGLHLSDVPLAPLLSRLDAPALLATYVALLTERRVMFVSQSISTLTSCVHAAMALLQPFEWQNIFIPVLDSSLLPYCCAPNPYVIGLTPSQFVSLVEEYDSLGELVLVALDEGYVACLNGAQALVDVEGKAPGGVLSYAGPKLSAERAAARASGGSDSPSVASSFAFRDALGGAGTLPFDAFETPVLSAASSNGPDPSQATLNRREGAVLAAVTQSAVLGGIAAVETALSPFHSYSRSHAYDDEVVTARAYRRAYMQRRALARAAARAKVQELFGRAPGQAKGGTRRPSGQGSLAGLFSGGDDGGAGGRAGGGSSDAAELDGFWAEESGTVVLAVDLVAMTTSGNEGGAAGRRSSRRVPSPLVPPAPPPTSLSRLGLSGFTSKLTAMVTGGPASDCPGARLAHEVREVYTRERREGAFDEAALYCAVLAFVGLVFARAPEFVAAAPGGGVRFGKEEFLRHSVGARYPTCARLLEEVQQSQLLDSFAVDSAAAVAREREAGGGMPFSSPSSRLNVPVQLLVDAAAALAAVGAYSNTPSSSANGSGGLGVAYSVLQRKVGAALAGLCEPFTDSPRVGDGPGVAGSGHSASSALAGLAYASTCAAAVSYTSLPGSTGPPATMPLIVTALRALLGSATSSTALPEESPAAVVRIACAASHDPHLLHVVLGVLWARINDCSDKAWPQGYRALQLLVALLRSGSPRVFSLSVAFIPLLRFLMHPVRAAAVRAGYFAEDLGGKADACGYVQAANVLSRGRYRGLFGGAQGPVPGIVLSTAPGANALAGVPVREGLLLVARSAARAYLLLSSPRRWLLERAVAAGPAAVSGGLPLAGPFSYPLIHVGDVGAPASAAYPPGWAPTAAAPSVPHPSPDVPLPSGSPPPYPPLSRQLRAGDAPWDSLHRVAAPPMASSRSRALAVMAAQGGLQLTVLLSTPLHVHAAIAALTAASGGMPAAPVAGSGGGDSPRHLSFLPLARGRPSSFSAACALPRSLYGGLPLGPAAGPAPGAQDTWLGSSLDRNSSAAAAGVAVVTPTPMLVVAPAPVHAARRPSGEQAGGGAGRPPLRGPSAAPAQATGLGGGRGVRPVAEPPAAPSHDPFATMGPAAPRSATADLFDVFVPPPQPTAVVLVAAPAPATAAGSPFDDFGVAPTSSKGGSAHGGSPFDDMWDTPRGPPVAAAARAPSPAPARSASPAPDESFSFDNWGAATKFAPGSADPFAF